MASSAEIQAQITKVNAAHQEYQAAARLTAEHRAITAGLDGQVKDETDKHAAFVAAANGLHSMLAGMVETPPAAGESPPLEPDAPDEEPHRARHRAKHK